MANALQNRIATLHRRQPAKTPVTGGTAYGAPVEAPSSQIVITPGQGAGITPLSPLITADGAAVPATGPGQWDQLVTAGRIA